MFKIKHKYLDNLNGFAFALLLAMPVIRGNVIPLPAYALIVPALLLFFSSALKLASAGNKKFNINILIYFYVIIILFLYLFISGFWNSFTHSLTEDVGKILFILITALSIFLTYNNRSVHYFLNWIIFFSIFATIMLMRQHLQAGNLRGYRITGYLAWAQLIGIGALVAYSKLLFYSDLNKYLYGFLTFILFIGLAVSLARGALLSGILLAVIMSLYYFQLSKTKSYSLTEWFKNKSSRIISAFFIILVIFAATRIERTANRLMRLFSGTELEVGGRGSLWTNSLNGFLDSPVFGHGLGSSGMISIGRANYYPHNLFLQIMVDGGAIAFVMLFFLCFYPLLRTYQLYKRGDLHSHIWLPVLVSFTFLFLEFSKSSSFYEGRVMIALGLILVIIIENLSKEKNTHS